MSAEALPISPARFALAIKDLPLTTLHLKAAELRNSIAHLEYSNLELKPYASPPSSKETPDAVCAEAIKENEEVMGRMQERLDLLKVEVEGRGASWLEFMSNDEVVGALNEGKGLEGADARIDGDETPSSGLSTTGANVLNGVNGTNAAGNGPWQDGTFQVGRISGGEVVMDGAGGGVAHNNRAVNQEVNGINGLILTTNGSSHGGRIDDEEMRRRMEERIRETMGDDDEGGMHL